MSLPVRLHFDPYAEYKQSELEWVDSVPAHWDVLPTFAVACESKYRNSSGAESNVLSLSYGSVIRRDVETNFGLLPESFDTYQIVDKGDIILRLTDLQNDKRSLRVGRVTERGIITSAYLCLRHGSQMHSDYLYKLLHSYDTSKVFYGMGGGLRQSMKFQDFRRLLLLVPPFPEQKAISSFLDRETGKIDKLIEKQEQMIKLLKEKRQAVISHAVTKGLNPDVPMKDSGIEWLGAIPEHWGAQQLRHSLNGLEQGKSPECENRLADSTEWGVLKSGCVNRGQFDANEHKALPIHVTPFREYEVKQGDLLMSRASGSRDLIGSVGYVHEVRSGLLLSDKTFRFKTKESVDKKFLCYEMFSQSVRRQIEIAINGAEGLANNITQHSIKGFYLAVPPYSEQMAIVNYLKIAITKIDNLIAKAEQAIELMKERRTALISAAVTGKIDVREKA